MTCGRTRRLSSQTGEREREAEISAGPASLRDRSASRGVSGQARSRYTDLDEVQEDAHAYLTNIDSGARERSPDGDSP